jgi:hypothetical protein
MRYGERPRSWGAIHFALPAFSCTPIHRAVAQPGHGFVVRFIVGLKHFSPVQVAFLSVWRTLVLSFIYRFIIWLKHFLPV